MTAASQPESVNVDSLVNSLDLKQRVVFNFVEGWAGENLKYITSVNP